MYQSKVALNSIIIWLAPRAAKMTQVARCAWLPERARWSHLARSGLPAVSRKKNFPESHKTNPLLTNIQPSSLHTWSITDIYGLVDILQLRSNWNCPNINTKSVECFLYSSLGSHMLANLGLGPGVRVDVSIDRR